MTAMQTGNAIGDENPKLREHQISVASLKADIDLMRSAGFWPSKVECGPLVFELLVNWTIFAQHLPADTAEDEARRLAKEARMREELRRGLTNMTFNEVPVCLFNDVPDGRFWPSRERGGLSARRINTMEMENASV
jgi:hypothetical protein